MKKTLSSILLGLTLATGAVTAQTNFRSIDFNEALKQSQAENKLVFIDFYTDWCGPCRKMSKEVFPQKQVGDYFNAQFVCIKLNAEKEGEELAQKFEVNKGLPYLHHCRPAREYKSNYHRSFSCRRICS